jgi:hypothetical protein
MNIGIYVLLALDWPNPIIVLVMSLCLKPWGCLKGSLSGFRAS